MDPSLNEGIARGKDPSEYRGGYPSPMSHVSSGSAWGLFWAACGLQNLLSVKCTEIKDDINTLLEKLRPTNSLCSVYGTSLITLFLNSAGMIICPQYMRKKKGERKMKEECETIS